MTEDCYQRSDAVRDIAEPGWRELKEKKDALIEKIKKATCEINEVDLAFRRICRHEWKWEQVAGEGKTCWRCGARDYSDD